MSPGVTYIPVGVDNAVGLAKIRPDGGDLAVADQHVRAAFKRARGVEDGSVGNQDRGRLGHQAGSCASRPTSGKSDAAGLAMSSVFCAV